MRSSRSAAAAAAAAVVASAASSGLDMDRALLVDVVLDVVAQVAEVRDAVDHERPEHQSADCRGQRPGPQPGRGHDEYGNHGHDPEHRVLGLADEPIQDLEHHPSSAVTTACAMAGGTPPMPYRRPPLWRWGGG